MVQGPIQYILRAMEQPLSHLLDLPEDEGAFEPLIERAPMSKLIRPAISDKEELRARAASAAEMFKHGLEATMDDEEELIARQQFNRHIQQLPLQTNTLSRPAIVLKLSALMSEYDYEVARDASQLRTYITNRLLEESDPKQPANVRMRALENLGKITGVDLFTERKEITVKSMPVESLEEKLHAKLKTLLPAEYAEILQENPRAE